jgi:hypothetical protein
MLKVTKTQALSYLKKGFVVTVHRNMVAPNNPMGIGTVTVSLNDLLHFANNSDCFRMSHHRKTSLRFNRMIDSFEYYNHDSELGDKTCYSIDN